MKKNVSGSNSDSLKKMTQKAKQTKSYKKEFPAT